MIGGIRKKIVTKVLPMRFALVKYMVIRMDSALSTGMTVKKMEYANAQAASRIAEVKPTASAMRRRFIFRNSRPDRKLTTNATSMTSR